MPPVISRVAEPALVLDRARDAAQGQDVRLGGGATTIRQFLGADCDREQIGAQPEEVGHGALWGGEGSQAGGHRWFEFVFFVSRQAPRARTCGS
jgi:dihydrofolate reductase